MIRVGIKELNENLGEYVARVCEGERILVLVGGEAVAELAPLSPTRRKLLEAAEAGEIHWNGGKPKGASGIVARGESMSDTIIRARG
jgi:antitoxin (DNA-binding transcriptional repressor) of toxin-antitoxin stability system